MSPLKSLDLPQAPSLQQTHLRAQVIATRRAPLEVLVPVAAPYVCQDPAAPHLVLVPGLGMDADGFIRQLALGPLAHLHLLQTPNPPVSDSEDGLGGYAQHVEEYISAQRLEQQPGGVVLGGCSMGGAVSLAVACRARVKLKALLLIGTFGACRHLPRWQRVAAPLAWLIPWALMRGVAWQIVARTSYFGTGITPAEADWLVSFRRRRTQRYFAAAARALTCQNQIDSASALRLPTLVLHGTGDKVLPYAAGVELAGTIPGAKLVTIDKAGHAVFFTHHMQTNAAIAEFLRNQLSPSA